MVNFGYGSGMKFYDPKRKSQLANALSGLLIDMRTEGKLQVDGEGHQLHVELEPYIEVDGLYEGVRIRKITHLKHEEVVEMRDRSELIYRQVMLQGKLPWEEYDKEVNPWLKIVREGRM
jgi:hypothetical protein